MNNPVIRVSGALAVLCCMAAPVTAQSAPDVRDDGANEWAVIDQTDYGTISLDTAHVVALEPDVYQVRTHWRFAKRQATRGGARYDSSLAERVVNCRSHEVAIVEYADMDGDRIVNSVEQPIYAVHWSTVPPGSLLDRIAARTCELGQRTMRMVSSPVAGG
jgi:hypothetical protein